jgi:hypothetical protein
MLPDAYQSRKLREEAKADREAAEKLRAEREERREQGAREAPNPAEPLFGDDPVTRELSELREIVRPLIAEREAKAHESNVAAVDNEITTLLSQPSYKIINTKSGKISVARMAESMLIAEENVGIPQDAETVSRHIRAATEEYLHERREERAQWEAETRPKPPPAAKVGGLPNSGTSLSSKKDEKLTQEQRDADMLTAIERIRTAA